MAKDVVDRCYSNVLDVEDFEHGNQLEYQSIIKHQVEKVLNDGSYLEGGLDVEVRNNSSYFLNTQFANHYCHFRVGPITSLIPVLKSFAFHSFTQESSV
jgi:hypothetical protein